MPSFLGESWAWGLVSQKTPVNQGGSDGTGATRKYLDTEECQR